MSGPDALTSVLADLQDFPFMPLHVARLRDSDLAAEAHPEACWYAVLLWSASWHQLPAGSLPDNEAVLMRLCGLGRDARTFRKHRADAMRGWVRCSDGRLYHPVVAEQVNAAWAEKLSYRERKAARKVIAEKAAEARWGKSSVDADADAQAMHDASKPDASCMPDAMLKGRGRGTGSYSDTDVSAADRADNTPADLPEASADPLTDPAKVMFDSGIVLLGSASIPEPKARTMLGKWLRDHGAETVIIALGKAQREGAIDPKSFIEGCLKHAAHQSNRSPDDARRGRRPEPAVDMFRSSEADIVAERASGRTQPDRSTRAALPSYLD